MGASGEAFATACGTTPQLWEGSSSSPAYSATNLQQSAPVTAVTFGSGGVLFSGDAAGLISLHHARAQRNGIRPDCTQPRHRCHGRHRADQQPRRDNRRRDRPARGGLQRRHRAAMEPPRAGALFSVTLPKRPAAAQKWSALAANDLRGLRVVSRRHIAGIASQHSR